MEKTFAVLNALEEREVLLRYAIGGALAKFAPSPDGEVRAMDKHLDATLVPAPRADKTISE